MDSIDSTPRPILKLLRINMGAQEILFYFKQKKEKFAILLTLCVGEITYMVRRPLGVDSLTILKKKNLSTHRFLYFFRLQTFILLAYIFNALKMFRNVC